MSDWPDGKIRSTALWYIGKHTTTAPTWRYTLLDGAHRDVLPRVQLRPGELPLVSSFFSEASWYLLTTRRVIGSYAARTVDVTAVGLQYETGRASMAPIYYFLYWKIKYPVLDKLKADPGATVDGGRDRRL